VDSYLSVTWCNYFAGDREAIIKCAAEAIRRSKLEVKPKGRFAVAQVFLIDSVLRQKGHKVRFVHEAEEDNPAHAALRRWPNEDLELLERLAEEVWHETFSKEQIDRLPLTSCQTAIGV